MVAAPPQQVRQTLKSPDCGRSSRKTSRAGDCHGRTKSTRPAAAPRILCRTCYLRERRPCSWGIPCPHFSLPSRPAHHGNRYGSRSEGCVRACPQPVLDAILEVGLASPCETQMSDVGHISGLQLQKEARPQRAHARLHASGKCIRQEILVKTLLRKICSFTDTGVGLNSV